MSTKKILLIVAVVIIAGGFVLGSSIYMRLQKQSRAQNIADEVINNLGSKSVYELFPEKYFPKKDLEAYVGAIQKNCDWNKRDGKYVDFFKMNNIGGDDQTSFIYEYFLNCDSLRLILSVNTEHDPELMGFNIEPLEVANRMVLFPEKQLINR